MRRHVPTIAIVLTAIVLAALTGCEGAADDSPPPLPSAQNPLGYRHSAADTLQVLVPVCDGEQVRQADLRMASEASSLPPAGVDVPAENGAVDLLIGYPSEWTPKSSDLRLSVTTTRTTYDVAIPPTQVSPAGDEWSTSDTGEVATRSQLLAKVTC